MLLRMKTNTKIVPVLCCMMLLFTSCSAKKYGDDFVDVYSVYTEIGRKIVLSCDEKYFSLDVFHENGEPMLRTFFSVVPEKNTVEFVVTPYLFDSAREDKSVYNFHADKFEFYKGDWSGDATNVFSRLILDYELAPQKRTTVTPRVSSVTVEVFHPKIVEFREGRQKSSRPDSATPPENPDASDATP